MAEKKKEIVKVNIEVVLIVLWQNCLQFDNPIKHRHLYTKTWDVAEKVWMNKAKTSQKLARIKKEKKPQWWHKKYHFLVLSIRSQ